MVVLTRDDLNELYAEAALLVEQYDRSGFKYDSVDTVALDLFERSFGLVVIGCSLNNNDVHIHARRGHVNGCGIVYVLSDTETVNLKGFVTKEVAKFAHSLCDLVIGRVNNGLPDVQNLMLPNAIAYAKRTQREVSQHI